MERKQLSNQEISRLIEARSPRNTRERRSEKLKLRLRKVGAKQYNMALPETNYLQYLLGEEEQLKAIVYGRYRQQNGQFVGRGALVATDSRVVLLDKKPGYLRYDELSYESINGVAYTKVFFTGTVLVHTNTGAIRIRTFNPDCAQNFVREIEEHLKIMAQDAPNKASLLQNKGLRTNNIHYKL